MRCQQLAINELESLLLNLGGGGGGDKDSANFFVKLLALAVPDSVKTEITIAYPERSIMECSLVVIVKFNTRLEVVEAVLLMLFKSLIWYVHPEASWN